MIRSFALCLLLLLALDSLAQTVLTPLYPNTRRIDDFEIRNDGVGFLAANDPYIVLRTMDGGLHFDTVLDLRPMNFNPYLRSIRMMGDSTVFLGTLMPASTLLRSTDLGESWVNLTPMLPDSVTALCGLFVVGDSVIYGTGRYFGDAYFIKSSDAGMSWVEKDMRTQASNLIDVHFTDANHGYLVGRSNDPNEGGVLLETIDGGQTWTKKRISSQPGDRAWKFFKASATDYYVSLENSLEIPNRYWRSFDAGQTWTLDTIHGYNFRMLQSVAFLGRDTGYAGGHFAGHLYTYDGGASWTLDSSLSGFNRMQMMGDRMYISGKQFVYAGPANAASTPEPELPMAPLHLLKAPYPNPVPSGQSVILPYTLGRYTNVGLALTDLQGRALKEWPYILAEPGDGLWELDLPALASGVYLLHMYTDIEHHAQKLVVR